MPAPRASLAAALLAGALGRAASFAASGNGALAHAAEGLGGAATGSRDYSILVTPPWKTRHAGWAVEISESLWRGEYIQDQTGVGTFRIVGPEHAVLCTEEFLSFLTAGSGATSLMNDIEIDSWIRGFETPADAPVFARGLNQYLNPTKQKAAAKRTWKSGQTGVYFQLPGIRDSPGWVVDLRRDDQRHHRKFKIEPRRDDATIEKLRKEAVKYYKDLMRKGVRPSLPPAKRQSEVQGVSWFDKATNKWLARSQSRWIVTYWENGEHMRRSIFPEDDSEQAIDNARIRAENFKREMTKEESERHAESRHHERTNQLSGRKEYLQKRAPESPELDRQKMLKP